MPDDEVRTSKRVAHLKRSQYNDGMNIGSTLYQLPEQQRKVIRKKEKLQKKVIKNKYAIVFNQTCIKEDILPAYTHIKLYDQAVA